MGNNLRKFLIAIAVLLIAVSTIMIAKTSYSYLKDRNEYKDLSQKYVSNFENAEETEETEKYETDTMSVNADVAKNKEEELVSVDISGLKEVNPEVVGWIRCEDFDIDYPVLKSDDNEKYLTVGWNGEANNCGAIFEDFGCSEDFTDLHTIIYGHNMKDGSMFGKLKDIKSEEYSGKDIFIYIYTVNSIFKYKIFAFYDVNDNDSLIYRIGFNIGPIYDEFLNTINERTYRKYKDIPNSDDSIISLSTCSATNKRFIVNAYLVEEVQLNN